MGRNFCDIQNLISIRLIGCNKLEELPHLHMLRSLRKLEIIQCPMLRKLPRECGGRGAFPYLEMFSLAFLSILEELPLVEKRQCLYKFFL
jgi:hypothetical protein